MESSNTTDRSVSAIIKAFLSSLQEFKNYRERKRKAKKTSERTSPKRIKSKDDNASSDELLLSRSLRQGAVDVQAEYDRHYRTYGDRYAVGDERAYSSLARTMRKINTCFQNIIAALLQKDAKIDYKYLTSVSDISRQEALETLSQLSVRMSMSAYALPLQKEGEKHKRHSSKDSRGRRGLPSSKSASDVASTKTAGSKTSPKVKKVQLKSASQPQLAMVRPKPRRSGSSKSAVSMTVTEVPPTPTSPPKHTRKDSSISINPPASPVKHRRKNSGMSASLPISSTLLQPIPAPPQPRRQDKLTPSVYTYASISTTLGEIPEVKWSLPYDHDSMSRLNKEHGGRPWPPPPEPTKPRRGFLGLFKKSEFKTAEVVA